MSGNDLEFRTIERLLRVPNVYRNFRTGLLEATRYGLEGKLLERLLDSGLPHAGHRNDVRFDILDLENIALNFCASPYWNAIRLVGKSLSSVRWLESNTCEVEYSWGCPNPGHEGNCHFTPTPEALRLAGADGWDTTNAGVKRIEVRLLDDDYHFGDSLDPLVAEAKRMTFHKLPRPLGDDLGFLAVTGLADCRLGTHRLVQLAAEIGLTARLADGFLGSVFPEYHIWPEIQTDAGWRAADPFFLNTLHEWGVVDSGSLLPHSSPRHILWRVATMLTNGPLVLHNEQGANVSFQARRSPRVPNTTDLRVLARDRDSDVVFRGVLEMRRAPW